MNDEKLKKLFAAARSEMPPTPPSGFDEQVIRAMRNEVRRAPVSLWEQLDALFPRLAIASVLVVGACVLGDYYYSAVHPAGLEAEVNAIAEQWAFPANGS